MKKILSSVLMLTVLACGNAFAQTKTKTTIKPPPPAPKITTTTAPAPKPAPVQRPATPAPAPKVVTPAKPAVAPAKPAQIKPVVKAAPAPKKAVAPKKTATKAKAKKQAKPQEPGIYTGNIPEPTPVQNYNITQRHNGPTMVEIKDGRVTVNDEEVARINDAKRDCIRISIDQQTAEPKAVIIEEVKKECKPRCRQSRCGHHRSCGTRCSIPTWKCKGASCPDSDDDRRRELHKNYRWHP